MPTPKAPGPRPQALTCLFLLTAVAIFGCGQSSTSPAYGSQDTLIFGDNISASDSGRGGAADLTATDRDRPVPDVTAAASTDTLTDSGRAKDLHLPEASDLRPETSDTEVTPLDAAEGPDSHAETTDDGGCVSDCTGKMCGEDGCGGSCGTCPAPTSPCLSYLCDTGSCQELFVTGLCNDGSICTAGDQCSQGTCFGVPIDCDDGLPCTDDGCDPVLGCIHVDNGQPCQDPPPVIELAYDIVVVGAGSGGSSAAIQAARLGMSVALLEETDWVGGQMTAAAVTSMDEGTANRESGLYVEFITLIKAHYDALSKAIGTCYWSNNTRCFEPRVGRDVLEKMLDDQPSIELFLRTRPTEVDWEYSGGTPQVTGVSGVQSSAAPPIHYHFSAEIVIDATEWGDVIALSPAKYRIGNSTSNAPDPAACVQDNTYTAVIRKYQGGPPAALLLSGPPPGYTNTVKEHFESLISNGGANWISGPNDYPADWLTHVGYRGMPDSATAGSYDSYSPALISRTGVNWANDYPYLVADLAPAVRKTVNCQAKLRSLQFLYYMQHDLGQTQWSVANDEDFNSPYNIEENLCPEIPAQFKEIEKHFPVMPYARESRRIFGIETVTGDQIRREVHCPGCPARAETNFTTALAVGDYPVDLHACNENEDLELQLESTADVPPGFQGGAFQVPFEVFVPETVNGLLAAEKNLSVSRLVNGSIRLQPITMLTGQAVGVVAALAVSKGIHARSVLPLEVQDFLVANGCRLALQDWNDVPRSHPRWADIQLTAVYTIMGGYSDIEFGVNDELTRGWAAAAITRLFGVDTSNPPAQPTFGDVPPTHPAYEYIEGLYAAGMTNGCSVQELLYCPDDPLNRGALAKFLVSGLGLDIATAPIQPYYQDLPNAQSHWSFPWAQLVTLHDLMGGCAPNQFCPDGSIPREESAAAMANCLRFMNGLQ